MAGLLIMERKATSNVKVLSIKYIKELTAVTTIGLTIGTLRFWYLREGVLKKARDSWCGKRVAIIAEGLVKDLRLVTCFTPIF